jgi:dihydrofolate synthase/folylpolyglutamate synthase
MKPITPGYSETLEYLYEKLPMYQRIGPAAYKPNLDNTLALCKMLGNPESRFRSVHIAGTNGKGSTSHMLAAILQNSGLKVGLYTSPHLQDFRERIRINGKTISQHYVVDFVKKHRHSFEEIAPSFFEWTVGLAFDFFANSRVDVAILETGLGGRLDSTNVVTPLLSVITNISYDHMNLLGDTLEKIAIEKAGIIKPGVPVVIGETQKETEDLFRQEAEKRKAPVFFADKHITAKMVKDSPRQGLFIDIRKENKSWMQDVECGLRGSYQLKNIVTVSESVLQLRALGFRIEDKDIRKGILYVSVMTGLRGRWEQLSTSPPTFADTGHNEAGIKEVLKQFDVTPHSQLFFVLGVVNDKDLQKILSLLPARAEYFFCSASVPRALDAKVLQQTAQKYGLKGNSYASVREALDAAQKKAKPTDLVFVGGSTFTVADAL